MDPLLSEIMEQPAVLERLIALEYAHIAAIAAEIRRRDARYVLIAARGTSDNAATYAKYLFGALNGLPVALAAPSLFTLYEQPPRLRDTLVIGISQSGMSPDIVAVLQTARAQGNLTVAIVNSADSRLADAAEHVILVRAGEERSIAATKSYTAELMALALLAVALADRTPGHAERLVQAALAPQAVAATLALSETIARRAERYRYLQQCAVVARGYNYCTAFEIALKLKELTYVGANPYSSADFLHGPIAVVGEGFPVVVAAPSGRALPGLLDLLAELTARRAELLVISDDDAALAHAQTPLRLPAPLPEWLSPITAVVPGQLLAYHLTCVKGLDPQRPRGLRKITETT